MVFFIILLCIVLDMSTYDVLHVIIFYFTTRSSGRFAPLLLAPAEGLGALRAPWGPAGPAGGLWPPVGLLQCPNLEL